MDVVSKWIVQLTCVKEKRYTIIPNFLYVYKTYNTGMAFSMGANKEAFRIIFSIISLLVSIGIAIYYFKSKEKTSKLTKAILALIFAGALGNFIDRLLYKHVIDFIRIIC